MASGNDREQEQILAEIVAERTRQDAQWGGADHDDTLDGGQWLDLMYTQLRAAYMRPQDYRERLVKVAALAVAGSEARARERARSGREGEGP